MRSACRFVRLWTAGVDVLLLSGAYEMTRADAVPNGARRRSDARAAMRPGGKITIEDSFKRLSVGRGTVLEEVSAGGTSFLGLQYSAEGSIFRMLPSDVFASFRTPYASQVSSPAMRVMTA